MKDMTRFIAIGDIHGAKEKLDRLLGRLDLKPDTDTLVFMGDYVDRGEMVFELVERLIDIGRERPGTIFLKGNHDQMFQDFLSGRDRQLFMTNGGNATLESYMRHRPGKTITDLQPPEHKTFFESLKLFHETEDFIFVHAGLRPKVPLSAQQPEDLLWIREPFISSLFDFGKRVVFGHTPFPEPLVMKNKIGIDTGAGYGMALTAVVLPEMTFVSE
jgi:serine/threonine protein phosphatase 1